MTSAEVRQELELFDLSVAILDQAKVKDDSHKQKYAQAVQRLRAKVSLQDVSNSLDDATRRNDADDKRIAQRALGVIVDVLPTDAAEDLIRKGLLHADPSTRASSVTKLIAMLPRKSEHITLIGNRVLDVDTNVAKVALDGFKLILKSDDAENRLRILKFLDDALAGYVTGDSTDLMTDKETYSLRIWETCAELLKASRNDSEAQPYINLLGSLFVALETWNDDVLFVLNLLEIAASLPRTLYQGKTENLIAILLRYANEQEFVADDALRVLAGLHYNPSSVNSREKFFNALNKRMSQEFFSFASLEVFAMFAGSSAEAINYTIKSHRDTCQSWLSLLMKFAHEGNEMPRNVALDALSRFLRGGSLLKDPLNPESSVFVSDASDLAEREASALASWELLKADLPQLLNSILAAMRSLHPQVQMAAYGTIRMLVSQNSHWGIAKVFEYISKDILLAAELPSPNHNYHTLEARRNAIAACALRFLDDVDDAGTLKAIKQFSKAVTDGTLHKMTNATVDVATMRA